MSYEVTATKKRPQSFDSIVGQDFVVSTLKSSLELGRIAHAYLFSGPRGVGKTSAARILAKALNCEQGPTSEPCGTCSLCREITSGNSLDVIEIDGASNTSVNDVRELKDEVLFAPNSGRYKIYIIDEVHMLSTSAFNALLKTIEEPPPYIVFIFATTEVHKVPATIRSRCQQFNFRLIPVETIKERLRETVGDLGLTAEEEALFWIAKEATGSLRDAYTLFDQIASFSQNGINLAEIQEKLGLVGVDAINEIAEAMADEDGEAVIEKAEEILAQGVAVEQFIVDLAEYFRNILFLAHGVDRESALGYPPSRFSEKVRRAFTSDQLEYALDRLFTLYRNLRFSLNQRFETELVLSDLSSLPKRISSSILVGRIEALRNELRSGEGGTHIEASGNASRPEKRTESQSKKAKDAESGARPEQEPESRSHPEQEATADAPGSGRKESENGDLSEQAETAEETHQESSRHLSQEEINSLVEALKSRPSLSSVIQKVDSWRVDGSSLILICETSYIANKIKEEVPTLTSLASDVLGKKVRLDVHTAAEDSAGGEEKNVDEQAELVKKVFRGQIIENGAENEPDGHV